MATKVVRLKLIIEQHDADNQPVDFKNVNKILWELQQQTREIKNKAIQLCWEWNNFSSDYHKEHGTYPKDKDILKYSLRGFVNDKFKQGNDLYSGNCSTTIQSVCQEFQNAKTEIIKGTRSIISYKSNQPLDIHNKCITISFEDGVYTADLKLLNRAGTKKYNFASSAIHFKILVRDQSTRTILQRIIDGTYSVSASKLIYKDKFWYLNLSYSFEAKAVAELDQDKILGVDLGIVYPLCASVFGDYNRLTIQGGEIEEFRRRVEQRKKSLLHQGKNCGDGRIGHGIRTRNKPVYDIEDKIARFRDTANHKYSRKLIEFAVQNHCGIIQMEDLKGITNHADRFLKNWSYFDLQTKIEYKAAEAGIKVVYIAPKYTSQRCSRCGFIDKANRPLQAKFKCLQCGFAENADYNASQNISIKDIDKLINSDQSQSANDK